MYTCVRVYIYIYLYKHVQLQKLTNPSAKHLYTTTGQALPAIFSKISVKQKIKHRERCPALAAAHGDCRSRLLSQAKPGVSLPERAALLAWAESWDPLAPQSRCSTREQPSPAWGPRTPIGPGVPTGSWDWALTSAGSIPENPAQHGQRCQAACPRAPHPRQANLPSPAPEHPFGAVYLGGKK